MGTVTMTTNESANVYSKNMICSKRMARLQWELTLKAKLDAVKGDCMMGILDAKHIKNVDTSKMFADGGVAIGVSIGHNGSLGHTRVKVVAKKYMQVLHSGTLEID